MKQYLYQYYLNKTHEKIACEQESSLMHCKMERSTIYSDKDLNLVLFPKPCVFPDMSHAAQPSSPFCPPVYLHFNLWPHRDIMLTSGPHFSLCPQNVFFLFPSHSLFQKESYCAFLWSAPPLPAICIVPLQKGSVLTHLCLVLALSPTLKSSHLSFCLSSVYIL